MEMCARTGKYYATDETSDKKVMNCSPLILLSYSISIILKLKGHIKGRLISRILNLKKSIEQFKNYSQFDKEDQNVYKTANKSTSIHPNQTLFLAIGWSYLDDLSHTFLKRLKLL